MAHSVREIINKHNDHIYLIYHQRTLNKDACVVYPSSAQTDTL